MNALLLVLGFIALIVFGSIFRGYALSILWDWFVVAQFSVGKLAIPNAIGLAMIVGFLTYQHDAKNTNNVDIKEEIGRSLAVAILTPAMILAIGWIVKQFI